MITQGNWIFWSIIVAYIGFIFTKGVLKARKVGDSDDFLVAGRKTGWLFLFATLGASVIGGGASIGAVAKTYEWGVLMLVVSTGWYLGFIFSGLYVAPKFRENKLYTVAGYVGHRYGEKPRFVAFVLSLLFSVFVLAAQMAAFGSVLAAIMPDLAGSANLLRTAILVGGALVVIYSTAGGLLAVINTDFYQFIILLGGFVVTLALCVPDLVANWGHVAEVVPADFLKVEGGKGWLFLITTFLAFILGEEYSPAYSTRYCAGKDVRQTKFGIAGAGIFLALVFPAIIFFIALYARVHFPGIAPNEALAHVVKHLNHPVVAAMIIGAMLMAVMSSADSILNSATAIFVKDMFEHLFRRKAEDERKTLRLARICSVGIGVTAIAIAVLWSDIIGLLMLTYNIWAPAMILPITFGALSKYRSPSLTRNMFVTMVVSTVAALAYRLALMAYSDWSVQVFSAGVYGFMETFDTSVFGVSVSCVVFAVLHFFFDRERRANTRRRA
jgi:SSS family solute:Na+ symporter